MLRARFAQSLVLLVLGVVSASPATADRIPDGFNDTARDDSLWIESESSSTSGCRVREASGKLLFESQGAASFASYVLRSRFDWNDGFVVDWRQRSSISATSYASRYGRAGLAMGWGSFDPGAGFYDGVNVEVIRTNAYRRLVMTLRKGGQAVSSAFRNIGTGEYAYRLVCANGFGTSIELYLNDGLTPVLSLDGVDTIFSNRNTSALSMAFIANTRSGVAMDCSIDDFKAWGDLYDDSNDRFADDVDSPEDDDDEDGFDDSPDGSDEGEDDDDGTAARSVTVAKFNAALAAISASSPLPILESEVERVGSATVVGVIQWKSDSGQLVEVRANAETGAIVGSRIWTPIDSELADLQDVIAVLGSVSVSAQAAAAAAVTGGSTVAELELEAEDLALVWKVKFVTPTGVEDEAEVDAN